MPALHRYMEPGAAQEMALRGAIGTILKGIKNAGQPDPVKEPERWFREVLGATKIYPKQIDMIHAIASGAKQVSTCGANGSGKDFLAARIALWWMACHEDFAKVVITAPSFRQIKDVVWQELRDAYLNARVDLGGQLLETPYLGWDERRFIIGFSTDKSYKVQGFHSSHLLLIISEAHGMKQSDIDALRRLGPNCILMTGNPIVELGEFYDSHHSKAHLWQTINIDAFDTPNVIEGREVVPGLVTRDDIETYKANWGEDSPLYRMTVLNEWCEGMGQLIVVPLSWALGAEGVEYPPGPVEVVSVDVARFGADETVILSRRGRVVRTLWRVQGFDLMSTVGWIKGYHDDGHKFAHYIIDGVGVGAGVIDRLRELGIGVIDSQGGGAASDSTRYVNRVAENWWRMREAYAKGLDTEIDPLLRGEVSSRKYKIQSDRRIQLESKDDMRKAGRKSPNTADALAQSFALDWDLDGEHMSADSDVPVEEHGGNGHNGHNGDRASIDFGRGSDVAPWSSSRWSAIRGKRRWQ